MNEFTEWKTLQFKDICRLKSDKVTVDSSDIQTYISTENMLPNFGGVQSAKNIPLTGKLNTFKYGDVLFSNIRTYFKKVWIATFDGVASPDVLIFSAMKNCEPQYLYYMMCEPQFTEFTVLTSRGAKMPRGDKEAILNYEISLPSLAEQKAIASILASLDNKIDLLHRQNKTLESMAETLFRQWFVEEAQDDWERKPLTKIATFTNGLACQKYPPKKGELGLPVLKIKELNSGITDSSDVATKDVKPDYIVEYGDIIFAWSASLMVKIWSGERCVLNQHLFNVKSNKFPKWFIYEWCKYYLDEFISISQSQATTMGHIKRKDLDDAIALIPSKDELDAMDIEMSALFESKVHKLRQIQTLEKLRDTLLPKLMSGEVRVKYTPEEIKQ